MMVNIESQMDKWNHFIGFHMVVLAQFDWFIFGPMEECHVASLEAATWHLPMASAGLNTVEQNFARRSG